MSSRRSSHEGELTPRDRVELAETIEATQRVPFASGGLLTTLESPASAERCVAGRYRIDRHIGSGGFGSVYRAVDTISEREVAIKMLGAQSERDLRRFRYEATSLRLLQVPGVVRILDDGIHEGEAFIVMECVHGTEFPRFAPPVPWSALSQATLALLEVLGRVHALGVVHRDLKPSNVLVDPQNRVTILDFGVSSLRDIASRDGEVVGTPLYLSPEQAQGGRADGRSDLYAVGVMLFEALTGRLPHTERTARELMRAKVEQRAPQLRSLLPDVPPDLANIVDWLLEPHPHDRPASAAEVIDALLGRDPDDPLLRRLLELASGGPIDVSRLAGLFAGPDLFIHVPTDAATLALRRAGDSPDALAAELGAWVRAGLARCENDQLVIDRASLHRLSALPPRQRAATFAHDLSDAERDVLAWITVAGPEVDLAVVARASGYDRSTFDTLTARLEEHGLVRQTGLAGHEGDASLTHGLWSSSRVREAHRALYAALEPGHPMRMQHAVLTPDLELIIDELDAYVAACIRTGSIEAGRGVLAEAMQVARRQGDEARQTRVVTSLAELALTQSTQPAYDQLLYELGCMPVHNVQLQRLTMLANGARLSEQQDAERALAMLEGAGEFERPVLELRRRANIARVAQRTSAQLASHIASSRSWALAGGAVERAHLRAWQGRVLYRNGEFAEAAEAFLQAADGLDSCTAQMLERLNAASALLETYRDFGAVIALAEQVRREAESTRNSLAEARASWIERAARYRRGENLASRREIVEALIAIGLPAQYVASVAQEGAFAWRSDPQSALWYYRAVVSPRTLMGAHPLKQFCHLIVAYLERETGATTDNSESMLADAERGSSPPGVAAQVAALVAAIRPSLADRSRVVIDRARQQIAPEIWRHRREFLSIDECVEIVESAASR